jgi:hypothetical protein
MENRKEFMGYYPVEGQEFMRECVTCGAIVPTGIISLSGHWAECGGKGLVDSIKQIDSMPLSVEDKMDLVKTTFNITQ